MTTTLASYLDHTLLSPIASETDIRKLCEEAWIHQFKAVCVAPTYVGYAKDMLEFCPIRIEIATVIGFPLGYSTTSAKVAEAESTLRQGATELDVVMNLARFKSMAYLSVREEIRQLTELAHAHQALLKLIIETAYLDDFELHTACEIGAEAGVDFVKTSTGFTPEGATLDTVRLMRSLLPATIQIKASGGIRTRQQTEAFMEAGATRIGTSAGVAIMTQA
ncbi:deoxyribose-phosphate aldolase [Rhabdobacter roseus]|uniref:Deoxyribose-phosphate aldolase n=1 Tax=Rhabdobacter roseus TaxID=1655419 RepID=A0A840TNB8_9BACT|nr:deoxyribose-phosphate aldolase [Rhabdobacter roseus]MBB5284854.1 deoxyribose-phosphate aldolase [Rhabdobacter roseus]